MVSDPTRHQYCVILAGGMGSRFWPFSREQHPKQFIDFLGIGRSLLQVTYKRYRRCFAPERTFIVTNTDYADMVREQLPDLPEAALLPEPTHRNTAPSIAYAVRHLLALDPEAVVTVAPCDHVIAEEEAFVDLVVRGMELAEEERSIVTIGIRPTYPETNYGYIQAVDEEADSPVTSGRHYRVKTFTEKPTAEMAKLLMESGEFFWNSGLFIARADTFISELRMHIPELTERLFAREEVWGSPDEAEFVETVFPYSPSISFDYAVMEKAERVTMLLSDAGWVDVGTWSTVYAMAEKDERGNLLLGRGPALCNSCDRTMVVNDDPERLVAVEGIEDAVIVCHKDVVLVCKSDSLDRIKQLIFDAESIDPKYVK